MTWYVASLLFKSTHSEDQSESPPYDDLWEDSLILLRADTADAARQMAVDEGKLREVAYRGQGDDVVAWSFERVERVFEVQAQTLESGTELFSRFLKASEVESLLTKLKDAEP